MSTNMTPVVHTRRRSRSNSASSSLLTVKKSASLSSRSNPRASLMRVHQTSSDSVPLDTDLLPPQDTSRRRGSSDDGKTATNRNINRWSHSTSSSISAVDTELQLLRARLQGSSRRLSTSQDRSPHRLQANTYTQKSRDPSQNRLVQKLDSRQHSPVSKKLGAGQIYQQKGRSPNASTTSLTPTSVYNTTTTPDYFGETWHHRKQSNKFGEPVTAMSVQYIPANQQRPRRIDDVSQPKLAAVQHIAAQSPNEPPAQQPATQGAEHRKARGHRSPAQKTMLSKALAMANNAVLLDNAQNFDGAIEAYAEACDLLQQVMARSSDMDDRKKLSAIRSTYSNRIAELHDLDDPFANLMNKELPEDPPLEDLNGTLFDVSNEHTTADVLEQVHIPPRQESLLPSIFGGDRYMQDQPPPSRPKPVATANLSVPMDAQYAPPPLSPRRPPSPGSSAAETVIAPASRPDVVMAHHVREESTESTSWLDTIDDAESSHSSSQLSMLRFGNASESQNMMDEIEAEFDAALNAAVDAAYESDIEADVTPKRQEKHSQLYPAAHTQLPSSAQTQRPPGGPLLSRDPPRPLPDDVDTTDEEERLLDEMTQGYVFDDFRFDSKSKSALPRQSDSSSFSNRTFSSSVPSTTLTNGTTLSTLAETIEPPKPPPTKEIPPTPAAALERKDSVPKSVWSATSPTSPPRSDRFSINLRDRRLSGQSARQLKIETYAPARGTSQSGQKVLPTMPRIEIPPRVETQVGPHTAPLLAPNGPPSSDTVTTLPITPMTSAHSGQSQTSESPATPALTQSGSVEEMVGPSTSPSRTGKMMPPPAPIRKNLSSSSLRMRNLSVNMNDDSPITPGSAQFPPDLKRVVPPLPTPNNTVFTHHATQSGGMFLFDDHIGVPATPKTPNAFNATAPPAPLEPCPESFLLRPWWLMRSLYNVISDHRGGYLTTKLFVPRDIWRVKNVKLKLLDDKVAQCDFLTAALLKLAKVNEFDADAVLEELQAFESVLDQVRNVLHKKLGSDVGLSSSTNVFKSPVDEADVKGAGGGAAKNSFASGWRKLRSKSSNAAIPGNSNGSRGDSSATSGLTMPSLPMTSSNSVPTSRSYNKRNLVPPPTPTQLVNIPLPHATYMSSLARLCDAVQILDSIARQAEDPGLKCSNKTQVGLELGVRTAAEFFAFYILRFVMGDVGTLVDKFLKRGTEWVLA